MQQLVAGAAQVGAAQGAAQLGAAQGAAQLGAAQLGAQPQPQLFFGQHSLGHFIFGMQTFGQRMRWQRGLQQQLGAGAQQVVAGAQVAGAAQLGAQAGAQAGAAQLGAQLGAAQGAAQLGAAQGAAQLGAAEQQLL